MNFILLTIAILILGGDIAFFFLYLMKRPSALFISDLDDVRHNINVEDNTLTKHDIIKRIDDKLMMKRILSGVAGGCLALSFYLLFKSFTSNN